MNEGGSGSTEVEVSDARLLDAVRSGENAAYATLYERHGDAALAVATRLVRGRSEADDVVAETFARVLRVLQHGGGPADGFRAYLLTAVRHVAYDRLRGDKRQVPTEDITRFDRGEPFVDPALEGLERSLIARAYLSLPERYQAVLWHTEIEGAKPAEVAPLLGLTANGVAALAYRAREKLREGYLQMHLADHAPAEHCRPALGRLGAYVRGGLAKRDAKAVDSHLDSCGDCRGVYAELADVNVGLRGVIGPLVVGPILGGYLSALPSGALYGTWWSRMSKRGRRGTAAGVATAALALAVGLAVVSDSSPLQPREESPPGTGPAASDDEPEAPDGDDEPDAPDDPAAADDPGVSEDSWAPEEPASDSVAAADPVPVAPAPTLPPLVPPTLQGDTAAPMYAAAIDPVGALVPGRPGMVVFSATNSGTEAAAEILAELTLPEGVSLRPGPGAGSAVSFVPAYETGGWSCAAEPDGAACEHPGVDPGETATGYLHVDVSSGAELDEPLTVTLGSPADDGPDITAEGESRHDVSADGMPARYATAGNVRVAALGNALMSCVDEDRPTDPRWPPPDPAHPAVPPGPEADEQNSPLDLLEELFGGGHGADGDRAQPDPGGADGPDDQGRDPGNAGDGDPTRPTPPPEPGDRHGSDEGGDAAEEGDPVPAGSCEEAERREGELRDNDNWIMEPVDRDDDPATEMSASARWEPPDDGRVLWAGLYFSASGDPGSDAAASLKGPGAEDYTTVSAAEAETVRLPNGGAYQAFADVTELVAGHGGGEWWVADIPAESGIGNYAGWSMIVVVEDPQEPFQTAMVLDGAQTVFRDAEGLPFPFAGGLPGGVEARFDVVAWGGDADLGGDQVALDGEALAPLDGGGDPDNAFVGHAQGAVGPPLTFGTDVAGFRGRLADDSELLLTTDQDALLAGAVAVTSELDF